MTHLMTADELRNELGSLIWKTATNLMHGGKVLDRLKAFFTKYFGFADGTFKE